MISRISLPVWSLFIVVRLAAQDTLAALPVAEPRESNRDSVSDLLFPVVAGALIGDLFLANGARVLTSDNPQEIDAGPFVVGIFLGGVGGALYAYLIQPHLKPFWRPPPAPEKPDSVHHGRPSALRSYLYSYIAGYSWGFIGWGLGYLIGTHRASDWWLSKAAGAGMRWGGEYGFYRGLERANREEDAPPGSVGTALWLSFGIEKSLQLATRLAGADPGAEPYFPMILYAGLIARYVGYNWKYYWQQIRSRGHTAETETASDDRGR
jgi:hypothetical protein